MPSATASTPLTREIFGNIPDWSQVVFYVLAALAVSAWVYGIARRVRLWRQGTASKEKIDWHVAARRLVRDVLLQRRVWGRGLASAAHVLTPAATVRRVVNMTAIAAVDAQIRAARG